MSVKEQIEQPQLESSLAEQDAAPAKRMSTLTRVVTRGLRLRTRAFIPFAILLLWLSYQKPIAYWGLGIAVLGEIVRLWASGHIHKGNPELTTSGPYAYCRNPLYLGSGIMAVGVALAITPLWLGAALALGVAVLFIIFHLITIKHEERRLEVRYGEPYREYCAHVPRLLPSLRPWAGARQVEFQMRQIGQNKEWWRALGVAAFLVMLIIASKIK
jgi:protein-S-isoprenylcysteine O-methyltransferase Ste14